MDDGKVRLVLSGCVLGFDFPVRCLAVESSSGWLVGVLVCWPVGR